MRTIFFRSFFILLALPLVGAGCLTFGNSSNKLQTSGPGGMFVSAEKGDSWKPSSAFPSIAGVKQLSEVSVFRLFEDPSDIHAMYWATRGEGFYYSYDDGKSWQHANAPLNTGVIYSIAVDPKDKCTIYVTNGSKLYKSDDCSRNWAEIYREDRGNARFSSIAVDKIDSKKVYLGKINGEFLTSADSGVSWTLSNSFGNKGRIEQIYIDTFEPTSFYVVTKAGGLFRSKDSGVTWIQLNEPLKKFSGALGYRRFIVHPLQKATFFWVSEYGILKTVDGGDTWESLKLVTPPGSVPIYAFGISPKNEKEMYYATFQTGRTTFYKTDDGGLAWSTRKLPSGQVPTILRVHPEDGNIVYLGFSIPPKDATTPE